ncbi:hypothetical protein ACIBCR_14705 [Micromonospora echinospora]
MYGQVIPIDDATGEHLLRAMAGARNLAQPAAELPSPVSEA